MKIELTRDQITVILQALSTRPYDEVAGVIESITRQIVPDNCRECPYDINCKAWHYKGDKCKYKK